MKTERYTNGRMWGPGTVYSHYTLPACPYQIISSTLNNQIIHFDTLYTAYINYLSLSSYTKEISINLQDIHITHLTSSLLLSPISIHIHQYSLPGHYKYHNLHIIIIIKKELILFSIYCTIYTITDFYYRARHL